MTPQITLQNVEEYLLLSLDGELHEAEQAELDAFLEAHPELAPMVADYEATILPIPDPGPVFDGKDALLQPEPRFRKPVSFKPVWWAAAALLLIASGTYFALHQPLPEPALANQKPVSPATQSKPLAPIPSTTVSPAEASPAPTAPTAPSIVAIRSSAQPAPRPESSPEAVKPSGPPVLPVPEEIPTLPVATVTPFQQPEPELLLPETSVPVVAEVVASVPDPKGILAVELPLLNKLREAATEKAAQIRTVRREIKNTETTVAVAGYELFTIRF
jgi:hypothetical protein